MELAVSIGLPAKGDLSSRMAKAGLSPRRDGVKIAPVKRSAARAKQVG
jgi:hypothetical protein